MSLIEPNDAYKKNAYKKTACISDYMGLSGTIWDYLGLSETIWDYLGLSRSISDSLGLSRTVWDYLGLCDPKNYANYNGVTTKLY